MFRQKVALISAISEVIIEGRPHTDAGSLPPKFILTSQNERDFLTHARPFVQLFYNYSSNGGETFPASST
jgi:hypothetical protein